MGLYDDDLDELRRSPAYEAARRAMEALAPELAKLRAAVEALDAVDARLEDETLKAWRAAVVKTGREIRGCAGWDEFAEAHLAFVHNLDARDGMTFVETTGRLGYELWAPSSWRLKMSDDERVFTARPDPESGDAFVILMEAVDGTIERFAADVVQRLRREQPGCNIGPVRTRRLDRVDAREFELTSAGLRARIIASVHGNTGLTLTWRAAPERFERHEAAAAAIVEFVRLKR
jgi:hypothetical protein